MYPLGQRLSWAGLGCKRIMAVLVHAEILFANRLINVSDDSLLLKSIFSDLGAGIAVPLLELVAYVTFALCIVAVLWLLTKHKRAHKEVVPDSWEPVPSPDVAVQLFTALAVFDLVSVLLAVVLMVVPIVHTNDFAAVIYTCTCACTQLRRAPSPPRHCERALPSRPPR